MTTCVITLQPQDNIVRTLKVDGEVLIEGQYLAGDLPYHWVRENPQELWWAPKSGVFQDHYKIVDCKLYDYDSGDPGYHKPSEGWRDSVVLSPVTTTTTQQATTTTSQPTAVEETVPPTTYAGIAWKPPVEELPFTGTGETAFTLGLAVFGVGMILYSKFRRGS